VSIVAAPACQIFDRRRLYTKPQLVKRVYDVLLAGDVHPVLLAAALLP
jgi:hypothetical protein